MEVRGINISYVSREKVLEYGVTMKVGKAD